LADIFVSYTSSDREWAFWIGDELKKLGHVPHVHDWEISAGGDIAAWMGQRHNGADHTLCIISKAYLEAPYSNWQLRAAQWAAASDRPNFALPVFVEECKAPTMLATFKRCDLFGLNEEEARARLAAYLSPASPPTVRARFPGAAKIPPIQDGSKTSSFPRRMSEPTPEMALAPSHQVLRQRPSEPAPAERETESPIVRSLPRAPIKSDDDKWDVFLAYRSANRPWALRLYDQLRHLGYEVFMDQFLLTTAGILSEQLRNNLERSATAVLIWSSRSEHSDWCKDEYEALRRLEKSKPGFRFVVLRVEEIVIPLFARSNMWIDFSDQPDGPAGTGVNAAGLAASGNSRTIAPLCSPPIAQ
jgi:hypothetical protein